MIAYPDTAVVTTTTTTTITTTTTTEITITDIMTWRRRDGMRMSGYA